MCYLVYALNGRMNKSFGSAEIKNMNVYAYIFIL